MMTHRESGSNPTRAGSVQEGAGQSKSVEEGALETSLATVTKERTAERPDWSLAAAGDVNAFERLYRAHVARIHTLARRMAGEEVADDLTQEVFMRVWQKLWSFRGDASFSTWLHRLAVNHILSRRASFRRDEARSVTGKGILDGLRAKVPIAGFRLDFETAVSKLPEGARQVFLLYDVEGYRHDEIANLMGISVGTSKSQLHRARMLLRESLS